MVNEKLQGWTKKTHEFAIIAVSHSSRIFYEVKDDDYVSRKTKCPNNSVTNYFLYLVKKKCFSLLHGDKVQTHAAELHEEIRPISYATAQIRGGAQTRILQFMNKCLSLTRKSLETS